MKITTTERTYSGYHINGFNQIVREAPEQYEKVEVTGTLEELLEYSNKQDVLIRRTEATACLFPSWDDESKFTILHNGEASMFARHASEYGTALLTTVANGTIE